MKGRTIALLSILMMLISISGRPPIRRTANLSPLFNQAQQPHSNIIICGNDDFANQSVVEGWSGNGSASNPYLIENYTIQDPSYCLSISQVSVSFLVRNCSLLTTSYGPCVILSNTSNGCIEGCVVQSVYIGVEFYYARDCILDSNLIEGSRDVVVVKDSYNCTFTRNILTNGGVLLDSVDDAGFQHAFSDNTVMGRPLGYFSGVWGENIDASSFGQLILVNCTSVTLSGGNLWGVPYGILLMACYDCYLLSCNVNGSEYGVVVLTCGGVMVAEGEFYGNMYSGVLINRSDNCVLQNNIVYSNSFDGIMILGPNATIIDNSIYNNGGGIGFIDGWGGVQTINGLVTGNNVWQNSGYGIALGYGVSGCRLFSNVIHYNGVNARDDGSGNSWDNGVDTGNQWSDYSLFGVYQIPGDAGSVDHYPRAYSNTTNGIIDGFPIQDLGLAMWFSWSIIVIAIPVFLMIRTRRSE